MDQRLVESGAEEYEGDEKEEDEADEERSRWLLGAGGSETGKQVYQFVVKARGDEAKGGDVGGGEVGGGEVGGERRDRREDDRSERLHRLLWAHPHWWSNPVWNCRPEKGPKASKEDLDCHGHDLGERRHIGQQYVKCEYAELRIWSKM